MSDLHGPVAELYSAYVAELRAGFDQIEPWWTQLLSSHGRARMRLRWPAGRAAHPRILAIVRDAHRRLRELEQLEVSAPHFDDDAAWGSEAEGDPQSILAPVPEQLLVDRLHADAPELHARLVYLVMSPVGEALEPRPRMASLTVVEGGQTTRAFSVEGGHDSTRGLERLLGAGIDLRPHKMEPLPLERASEPHRLAHAAYLRDLELALVEAVQWWHDERRGSAVIGPAAHPRVLGVLQAYWALCHEINDTLVDRQQHVAPELMLLAWLRGGRRQSWLELLSALPYWPVGLDAKGRWS